MVEQRSTEHVGHHGPMLKDAGTTTGIKDYIPAAVQISTFAPAARLVNPRIFQFAQDGLIAGLEMIGQGLQGHPATV